MSNLSSLTHFQPELILTATILVLVIVDLFLHRRRSHWSGYLLLIGLIVTAGSIMLARQQAPVSIFLGMVAVDPLGNFFKILILAVTALTVLVARRERAFRGYRLGEFYLLLATAALGMFLMVSATDILMVYLAVEMVSISSFILAGYLRRDRKSTEASLKYIIYGAFSSGIMLFGLSLVFGLTGSTGFTEIYAGLTALSGTANLALTIAIIFILAGIGYKISAVPFHFWTPDVYEGAPVTVTAFLSVAPKAAGFALLVRFFNTVFAVGSTTGWEIPAGLPWDQLLMLLAVATMTLGNLIALRQTSVKRMLAYSSIAHAGYLLMAVPVLSMDGIYAIMLYLVVYALMNLGAFYVVLLVGNRRHSEDYPAFSGLGRNSPLVAIAMTIFMFSLTGIPPTAGFIGKFYLFAAVIKAGPQFYWLAIVGVLNSVVSLYYYLRVVKTMYFEKTKSDELATTLKGNFLTIIIVLLVIPTLVLGIYWVHLAEWIRNSLMLFL